MKSALFQLFQKLGDPILEIIVIGAVSINSIVEMVGISPYPRKESDFNYFNSSVVPNPPNPGISIIGVIEIIETIESGPISIISKVWGPK